MKDIKLTNTTNPATDHDIAIENFDFQLVSGKDRVRQNLRIRLLFVFKEWFLNTTYGMDYQNTIWTKNPNKIEVDNVIKSTIINTEDVQELLSYSSSIDKRARQLSVNFKVLTSYGSVSIEQEL